MHAHRQRTRAVDFQGESIVFGVGNACSDAYYGQETRVQDGKRVWACGFHDTTRGGTACAAAIEAAIRSELTDLLTCLFTYVYVLVPTSAYVYRPAAMLWLVRALDLRNKHTHMQLPRF